MASKYEEIRDSLHLFLDRHLPEQTKKSISKQDYIQILRWTIAWYLGQREEMVIEIARNLGRPKANQNDPEIVPPDKIDEFLDELQKL